MRLFYGDKMLASEEVRPVILLRPGNSIAVIQAKAGIQWRVLRTVIGFGWIPAQPVKGLSVLAKLLRSKLDAKGRNDE